MSKNATVNLVKDPYVKTHFPDQKSLDDFVKCCDPETGYLYFMDNFFMIQHPTKGAMAYHPWDYQKRLIHTYHNYRFSISLMPRQSGKCFGINTIVKLRNTETKLIEEITIGEFYERMCKMYDMSSRNEGITFPSFSQTQNDSYKLQTPISWCTHPLQEVITNKFRKFFRRKKSGISTWRKIVSIFEQFYSREHKKANTSEGRAEQKRKWFSSNSNGLLVKKDQWEPNRGNRIVVGTTKNFLIEEMYRKIRRDKWVRTVEQKTGKMVEKFQETKFFKNISKAIQSNNGILSIRSCVLCNSPTTGYGEIYEQRVSSGIKLRENDYARLYRHHREENNRIRWNLLAWADSGESFKGTEERKRYIGEWLPIIKDTRRRFYKESIGSSTEMPELSDQVERKFIETYTVKNYEIFTDTGWEKITDLHLTIPYDVYKLETESGLILECADTHILFDQHMNQIFAKNLSNASSIQTKNGIEKIKYIEKTIRRENMFDITVDSLNHRFYSNDILSHNSTSAAGYLLWYAMFIPDSTILIAAHKYTGSQEIMQRIRYAYENCPMHIKAGATTYNKGSIDFENGSRIVSATTTENTGRGMSISLLYLDEFAFVRPSIAELFWTSITPTLATGGKAIITSTPNSDEDQFALIWKGANKCLDEYGNPTELGINGFKAYRAHYQEQPGRDEKWADQMKAQLGEDRFNREIKCEFIIADETLINPNTLIMLEGTEPIDRMGQIRWYKKPEKGNIYCVGLDPSLGTGGDPAAIQIFEANTTTQIGEWKHNKTDIPNQIKLLAQITNHISEITKEPNNIYYSLENNSIGEAALVSLAEYGENNIQGTFLSEPGKKRKGFNTSHKVKLQACAKFKTLLESKKLIVKSRALISELKSFIANGGSYQAKIGETDDLIMATLLVVRMFQHLSDYDASLESHIRDHTEIIAPLPFYALIS